MKKNHPAIFYFRLAMAALALLLPLVSLMVFGSVWLWQHGYVLYWAIAACCVTAITYALERWLFRVDLPETAKSSDINPAELADPGWSARETAAWVAIVELSKQVRPAEITSRDQAFDLGLRAVETVARSMHPGEDHALWKFTLPEALALTERVSSQLSEFVSENIPLGDRMTVGQFLRVYRWRSAINVAEQAYDLWRIIRLINPAAAATQEIREQLTRRAYDWGREELAKRLTQAYVREVGKAAIELYSGRMRVARMGARAAEAGIVPPGANRVEETIGRSEPLRILVAGVAGSGKSDVINRLTNGLQPPVGLSGNGEYEAREFLLTGGVSALLIASPDLTANDAQSKALTEAAKQCDLVVWVTTMATHNRALERQMLDAVRGHVLTRADRLPPPFVCLVAGPTNTHRDHEFLATAARDLGFDLKHVLTSSSGQLDELATDTIRNHLVSLIPAATRAKLLRIVEQAKGGMRWNRLWSQVRNAGRRSWPGGA